MRIAIVGTGISGMVAAYLLCRKHDITVYEANDYVGGHTNTVEVESDGRRLPVDTGFIVFNEPNYPNFTRLLKRLQVPSQPAPMSFSVRCEKTGLEYSPTSLNSLLAQRRNLVKLAFWRMIFDVFRFRRESRELLEGADPSVTLQTYLNSRGYSKGFVDKFILPMGAAIWSADPERFRHVPAYYFVRFFTMHGFLNVRDQPQWQVVQGGSRRYVEALIRPYAERIRLNTPVIRVRRYGDHVYVETADGSAARYEHVVLAAHSDQALRMLADPSADEKRILGAMGYQKNLAVLHSDGSLMPRNRRAWASWNYHILPGPSQSVAMTYHMNSLQTLRASREFCVTLNHLQAIDPEKIHRKIIYHHPVYTARALDAQRELDTISGVNRTYFCGAYHGYGFHEDGVKSALSVGERFGERLAS